jgi:predicted amidohydrolase YtcJ
MDLVVEDAVFVTMAAGAGPVGAMLVRDGRIAAVGPAGAVRAAASPGARVMRLDGATVVPGLIDAHCHVADVGYLSAGADCSQPSAPDIPAVQALLREAAGRTPPGSWVTGSGYVEYKLREGRHPTRADLDQATPAPTWSWSILPTATTAVFDVRPACVPGRSVIFYRLGSGRPPQK